jgi:glycosyltransferase involved in cell wall biosynthesis
MAHNVRAERSIGLDSVGICLGGGESYRNERGQLRMFNLDYNRRLNKAHFMLNALREMSGADVVVWYGAAEFMGLDGLTRGVSIFNGAELRTPDGEMDNPHYRQGEWPIPEPEKVLRRFDGWTLLAENPSVAQYGPLLYEGRGVYPPQAKTSEDGGVVHVGSRPIFKGTDLVREQVPSAFIAQSLPHEACIDMMASCKVYVGQFGCGDLGIAEIDAMYLGKPVVTFVKPSLLWRYPFGLPIINTEPRDMGDTVKRLMGDARARRVLGRRGREYAYEHFDPIKVARRRADLYELRMSE